MGRLEIKTWRQDGSEIRESWINYQSEAVKSQVKRCNKFAFRNANDSRFVSFHFAFFYSAHMKLCFSTLGARRNVYDWLWRMIPEIFILISLREIRLATFSLFTLNKFNSTAVTENFHHKERKSVLLCVQSIPMTHFKFMSFWQRFCLMNGGRARVKRKTHNINNLKNVFCMWSERLEGPELKRRLLMPWGDELKLWDRK